jgi:type II secretory pathway pseudopilin PulG
MPRGTPAETRVHLPRQLPDPPQAVIPRFVPSTEMGRSANLLQAPVEAIFSAMQTHKTASRQRLNSAGFTLVELLVVITIVIVLAVLIFSITRRAMESAHQTRNAGQLREIGAGVMMWATENNYGEPMYFANGTGDFGEEGALAGKNPKLSPGNPAKLLYLKDDPESSYVPNHEVFFSGLTTYPAPSVGDYDPNLANSQRPWGTYVWLYPSTTSLTPRQLAAMAGFSNSRIGREAYGNVIMANDYRGVFRARFKPHYHALFRDGSVKYIGDSAAKWTNWYRGEGN